MRGNKQDDLGQDAFFESLWEAGITRCFVNLGSDHPSIMESIAKGQRNSPKKFPKIITCPNEMVALSMADGYARFTNKPQCVIVHVDVGTQGLGAAIHNASCGRAPVLIFAGLSPFTAEGEMRGSRTEYIHWIQDIPDQRAIVAQYCRYTAEIRTGKNIKQMVNRALSFAMSEPKGPVYLMGAREVMEDTLEPYKLNQAVWSPVEPTYLSESGVKSICNLLVNAENPLVVTGYSGRDHRAVGELVKLADRIKGLRVLDTGGSDMCFPADHRAWLGLRFGVDESIKESDVILVVDCDVPWIPTKCQPRPDAKIVHIDIDPLKQQMPLFYINAILRYRADGYTAFSQLCSYIDSNDELLSKLAGPIYIDRWNSLGEFHNRRLSNIANLATAGKDGSFTTSCLTSMVRKWCPPDTIWCIEAVTNTVLVANQIQATLPGSWINCGGGGLGWSGGGALGIGIAVQDVRGKGFVCQIVGDGTFLFSVPSSVYWISRRYGIPVLTIVINNKGWQAPRKSLLLVHPNGLGSQISNEELNISFEPSPDYAAIAKDGAGGQLWAASARTVEDLERLLPEAVSAVQNGTGAILDAHIAFKVGEF
ncbi:thiamine pyrophosphate enzyme, N-terminal TPP binding domain-containing protein [Talaromyces proteolyticus]|uniref:Thiamine pyrophosphate enzyme, N-terminal TPP binding domain-containing protein n=1 Tax=Talaromyces proteolyticus TaxID=1131652 RepID=A0AAD4Q2W9_9EURO|nr:thiamine pyrophosphate enzyme, N-terminal TPP binding domain-containing protein [Talaromyces proteolyticus]KAH8700822.1 thiamine pyrophosphate enzyme, N-terminal TPP binding domain-containing protein [Talaromyces proteolyticus]